MSTPPLLDDATLRQVEAADPRISVWLSANAGSGKTRVLTDRVARLLLEGTPPQNVLCLTYTKAAASEMQNRLFERLGVWAMLEDDALSAALGGLGVPIAGGETLAQARRLFARAIETPGGLKIQTIHSFCAAILRRFPLEAGLSPGFTEMDEIASADLQAEVMRTLALRAPDVVEDVARLVTDEDYSALCAAVLRHRAAFPADPSWEGTQALFGIAAGVTEDDIRQDAIATLSARDRDQIIAVLAEESKTMVAIADALADLAANGVSKARFEALCRTLLVADRSRANSRVPTKSATAALGPLSDPLAALTDALIVASDRCRALEAARRTHAVHRFAAAFLPAYAAAKADRALLDFDDLIAMTERLLSTPGVADWVLYRLDGEIDHVLVDEAQDTSPLQWQVIDHVTREFTTGEGSGAPGERTLFVVGDPKQSIYLFQGADPRAFTGMQDRFGQRLKQVGERLNALTLEFSFRSAPEILALVDQTFPPENREGLSAQVQHWAFKRDLPGRVDLWPRIEKDAGDDDARVWSDPVDQIGAEHHHARLARQVAHKARDMVDHARIMGKDGPRPVQAGDILILVQRRSTLFDEIIRACKSEGLDVAGADVLKLTEELAVKDVLALLAFLDNDADDLSLAAVLRSPLCGWSEGALYDLAAGRGKRPLWAALRDGRAAAPETFAMLQDLRDAADFLRPYELIERLLAQHDGRRRLVARLGPEAEDGIDALLTRALAHERDAVPGLTGFLAAQESRQSNVKRQAEARGSKLRVMTVHGAKGLESPIVFLPDTAEQRNLRTRIDKLLVPDGGAPLWAMSQAEAPAALSALRAKQVEARVAEARRLLYVAMTRAEQWLIVGAAGDLGRTGDTWYEQIAAGMEAAGAVGDAEYGAGGLRLQSAAWPAEAERREQADALTRPGAAMPAWTSTPVLQVPRARPARSPSDLGGAKALPDPGGLSEAAAMARGTRLHLLLEMLPHHPPEAWPRIAEGLVAPEALAHDELAEARRVLTAPDLAPFFAPETLAEVGITASPDALGERIHGVIDRLIVTPGKVIAADFKSNAQVPATPDAVPEGLLRQMGAYAAALAEIYPGREIETVLIWTRSARAMALPPALIAAALARAGTAPAHSPMGTDAP